MNPTYHELAGMIDHAILHPATTVGQLEEGMALAVAYQVASVCILPWYLARCSERLAGTGVLPSTVIGFPHGGQHASVKMAEAAQAIEDGGAELDMVVNISAALSGKWDVVEGEILSVTKMVHDAGKKIKIIFENCYLTTEQKIELCHISAGAGVDWVKTSTGYGTSGATMEDLRLMREHVPSFVQVKAAGGIKSYAMMLDARALGVSRIGTSNTAKLLDEARAALNLPPIVASPPLANGLATMNY